MRTSQHTPLASAGLPRYSSTTNNGPVEQIAVTGQLESHQPISNYTVNGRLWIASRISSESHDFIIKKWEKEFYQLLDHLNFQKFSP